MRVAIVHERFTEDGGSERVVEQFHRLWPEAVIHTTIVDRSVLTPGLQDADIRPSVLQNLYRGGRTYAHLLPLLPHAMRHVDVGEVDVVVTSHHAFANRIRPPRGVPVISYTHTPARWLWDPAGRQHEVGGRVGVAALSVFAATQRGPDRAAAARLRGVMVNSSEVACRVRRWWERPATVIPPPADVDYYTPDYTTKREDFFLVAGRLVPYKRADLAVAAAQRAGVRLVVVGEGRLRDRIREIALPSTEILGAVDPLTLLGLYRRCRALVMPGVEDFGIVPIEAQACGAPVLALAAGGVLDSVVDGVTGTLYRNGGDGVAALAHALRQFCPTAFDARVIREHAEAFSQVHFRERINRYVKELVAAEAYD